MVLICKTCNEKVDYLERHHIVPSSLGGHDEDYNIVKICINCHSKIHDRKFVTSRNLISLGVERAKKEGKYKGRKKGATADISCFLIKYESVINELSKGNSYRKTAKACGVSLGTVQKVSRLI